MTSELEPPLPSRLTALSLAHPWRMIAAAVALAIPFALALPDLQIRTEGELLHPLGNPVIATTREERERFRDPATMIVVVSPRDSGASIFTPEGLRRVQSVTESMRTVPGVRSDGVVSLATILDVSTSARAIRVTRFLDPLPLTAPSVAAVRQRLDGGGSHSGFLYGDDGRSAAVFAPLTGDARPAETIRRVRTALRRDSHPDFDARLAGPLVAESLLGEQVLIDLTRLVPLVVLVVAIALFLCLRTVASVVMPLLAVALVLTGTFGAMAMLGVPLTIVTTILPVLLMAMAITDEIHVLEAIERHLGSGMDRVSAVARALAETGPAILRTSLTTAIGFLSFLATSVMPMRQFGVFASLGILLAMLVTFTVIPAIAAVLPRRWLARDPRHPRRPRGGFEQWAGVHPRRALALAVVIVVTAALGLPRLRVQDSWAQNFAPTSDVARAEGLFNRHYHGVYRLDVTLAATSDGRFRSPAGLALVDSVERVLAALPDIAGTRSLVGLARDALRGVDPGRPVLALDAPGLAQLLLVLEMSGSRSPLEQLVTASGREARIQCFVRGANYSAAARLIERVQAIGRDLSPGPVELRVSGDLPIATEVVRATVSNQVRSVVLTLAGLGMFLAISFRSLAVAGILVLPVATTTLVVFGGMGFFAIPIGVATSMFAALCEGEGIDFSIHFASRYRALRRDHPHADAMREALAGVGSAIRWSGIALVAGCLILCFSSLRPVRSLGALLAAGMAVSYVMTFLVLPALLPLLKERRR